MLLQEPMRKGWFQMSTSTPVPPFCSRFLFSFEIRLVLYPFFLFLSFVYKAHWHVLFFSLFLLLLLLLLL
jgi:hypothetical protein